MIDLRPCRALHYDPGAVSDLADVIAPPYDVIDAAELERLYARSPHNGVRLILNRSPARYASAGRGASWGGGGAAPCWCRIASRASITTCRTSRSPTVNAANAAE